MSAYTFISKEQSCKLKALIIGAGLNIGIMADKMNMSRPTLSIRINGKVDFSKSEMERFAEILNCKPETIFFAA